MTKILHIVEMRHFKHPPKTEIEKYLNPKVCM